MEPGSKIKLKSQSRKSTTFLLLLDVKEINGTGIHRTRARLPSSACQEATNSEQVRETKFKVMSASLLSLCFG
jgi:hypothetical protein